MCACLLKLKQVFKIIITPLRSLLDQHCNGFWSNTPSGLCNCNYHEEKDQKGTFIERLSCFVALATTAPKLPTTGLRRSCLIHLPNLVFTHSSGDSDLPCLALKASRCGPCASFEASVCPRPFQISSWAPSLCRAAVAARTSATLIGPRRPLGRSRYFARAPVAAKSKHKHLKPPRAPAE